MVAPKCPAPSLQYRHSWPYITSTALYKPVSKFSTGPLISVTTNKCQVTLLSHLLVNTRTLILGTCEASRQDSKVIGRRACSFAHRKLSQTTQTTRDTVVVYMASASKADCTSAHICAASINCRPILDLAVYLNADMSMTAHVTATGRACFMFQQLSDRFVCGVHWHYRRLIGTAASVSYIQSTTVQYSSCTRVCYTGGNCSQHWTMVLWMVFSARWSKHTHSTHHSTAQHVNNFPCYCSCDKGAITSRIKHVLKLKTSPARLAQLLQPSLAFCFSLQPMTAYRPVLKR